MEAPLSVEECIRSSMGSAKTKLEPHFGNLLPQLSFFNSVPCSFSVSAFSFRVFLPTPLNLLPMEYILLFPQLICHHSFLDRQVRSQMGKRKKKDKATVDVPFCLVFKPPSLSSPILLLLFLFAQVMLVSLIKNQQQQAQKIGVRRLYSAFSFPLLLLARTILKIIFFFFRIEGGTLRWNLLLLIE